MVLSAIAAAAGAIMYRAITYQGTGFRLSTADIILVIAGGVRVCRLGNRLRDLEGARALNEALVGPSSGRLEREFQLSPRRLEVATSGM